MKNQNKSDWNVAQDVEHNEWKKLKWDRPGTLWHLSSRAEAARLLNKFVSGRKKISWGLDLGVGPASIGFLSKFGPPNVKIIGIEPLKRLNISIEDKYLSNYVNILQKKVRYVQAKGENLPIKKSCLDIAVCINVLDHTDSPEDVLENIIFCLKNNGILLFGNNIFSIIGRLRFEFLRIILGRRLFNFMAHPHSWNKIGIEKMLVSKGFRIIECSLESNMKNIIMNIFGRAKMIYWVCKKEN